MLGKPIKSGARLKAEKLILKNTNSDGFIDRKSIQSMRNQSVIKQALQDFRYSPKHSRDNKVLGYQITHKNKEPTEWTH